MLYIYLFGTIVGCGLLGVSLLGSDHGPSEHPGELTPTTSPLNIRFWTYFLAFGGLTGLLLSGLTSASAVLVASLSSGVGGLAGFMAQKVIQYMLQSGGGGTINHQMLVGKSARVLVPALKGATAMVRLQLNSSTVDIMAVCAEENLDLRDEVIIVEASDGKVFVTRQEAGLVVTSSEASSRRRAQ